MVKSGTDINQKDVVALLASWEGRDSFLATGPALVRGPYEALERLVDKPAWSPFHACYQFRDTFEFLLRFLGGLTMAEHFATDSSTNPNRTDTIDAALGDSIFIRSHGKLTAGGWQYLICRSGLGRDGLAARFQALEVSGFRLYSELPNLLAAKVAGVKRNRQLMDVMRTLVGWRNEQLAHGVFSCDDATWCKELHALLLRFLPLLTHLQPVFDSIELVTEIEGSDLQSIPSIVLMADPGVKADSLVRRLIARRRLEPQVQLDLTPYLVAVELADALTPMVLDHVEISAHKGTVSWHIHSHGNSRLDRKNLPGFGPLIRAFGLAKSTALAIPTYELVDLNALETTASLYLSEFATQVLPPTYMIQDLANHILEQESGSVFHITGSGGVGKTFLAASILSTLKTSRPDVAWSGGVVHLVADPGMRWEPMLLALHTMTVEGSRLAITGPQVDEDDRKGVENGDSESLASVRHCVRSYLKVNCSALLERETTRDDTRLLWIIDGLDEWRGSKRGPSLLAALPDTLPEGVCVICLSRGEEGRLVPNLTADLERLKPFQLRYGEGALYQALLTDYIAIRYPALPDHWRASIVERAGGRFLHVEHYAQGLAADAFRDLDDLPVVGDFYAAYLARLRDRLGSDLFDSQVLYILAIFASAWETEPIRLTWLDAFWGISSETFFLIYPMIRTFLHRTEIYGSKDWEFRIAHFDFVEWLRDDASTSQFKADLKAKLNAAHSSFLQNTSRDDWSALGFERAMDRFLLRHRSVCASRVGVNSLQLEFELRYLERLQWLFESYEKERRYSEAQAIVQSQIAVAKALSTMYQDDRILCELIVFNRQLGKVCWEMGQVRQSELSYREALMLCRKIMSTESTAHLIYQFSETANHYGDLCRLEARLLEAEALYREAIGLCRRVNSAEECDNSLRSLSSSLNRLGDLQFQLGRLDEAITCYDESLTLCRSRQTGRNPYQEQRDLGVALNNKGSVYRSDGRILESMHYFEQALSVFRSIHETAPTLEIQRDLTVCLNYHGTAYRQLGEFTAAESSLLEAISVSRRLCESSPAIQHQRGLSLSLNHLGRVYHDMEQYAQAAECFQEALSMRYELAEKSLALDRRRDLSYSLGRLSIIKRKMKDLNEARELGFESLSLRRDIFDASPTLRHNRELSAALGRMGHVHLALQDQAQAGAFFVEMHTRMQEVTRISPTVLNIRNSRNSIEGLSSVAESKGEVDEAIERLGKAIELQQIIVQKATTVVHQKELEELEAKLATLLSKRSGPI